MTVPAMLLIGVIVVVIVCRQCDIPQDMKCIETLTDVPVVLPCGIARDLPREVAHLDCISALGISGS